MNQLCRLFIQIAIELSNERFDAKYGLDNFMRKKYSFIFILYLIRPFGRASSFLLNFTFYGDVDLLWTR